MTGCRIGKVNYKKPLLSVIEPRKRGQFKDNMLNNVERICNYYPEGLAGYAIIGIGFDGTFSRGFRIDKEAPFGRTIFVAACSEILRRDIAEEITKDILNGEL